MEITIGISLFSNPHNVVSEWLPYVSLLLFLFIFHSFYYFKYMGCLEFLEATTSLYGRLY